MKRDGLEMMQWKRRQEERAQKKWHQLGEEETQEERGCLSVEK